jgi:hypothetical protein
MTRASKSPAPGKSGNRVSGDLTDEDARQIMHNVTGFFGVLAEWARAENIAVAANNNASPKAGEVHHER